MSVSTPPRETIDAGVEEFLRKNDARAAFQAICEIIRECFPQTLAVDARLEEDHDEPGWWRVVVGVTLPASLSVDAWIDQNRRYHERLSERLALSQLPLFVKEHEFATE